MFASMNGGQGGFADVTYSQKVLDEEKTNANTIAGMRNNAINMMMNSGLTREESEKLLMNPELNELPLRGLGRGRGDEEEDIERLLSRGPGRKDDAYVSEIYKEASRAYDIVSEKMNEARDE